MNDFVIPNKNEQTAEQHRGRHFQIMYDVSASAFLIKDLGVGYGAFVRQEHPIVSIFVPFNWLVFLCIQILKDNMLINVGEAYIVVNILSGSLIEHC